MLIPGASGPQCLRAKWVLQSEGSCLTKMQVLAVGSPAGGHRFGKVV